MNLANRVAAAAIVALLLFSLLRTRNVEPESALPADALPAQAPGQVIGTSEPRAPPPASKVRLEVRAEIPWNTTGPEIALRLRSREGALRPFDVTVREPTALQKLLVQAPLPVAEPELPIRGELLGDAWCIPPGVREFSIAQRPSAEPPFRLVLTPARVREVMVVAEADADAAGAGAGAGAAVAGARLVHESGFELARTGKLGRARLLRPATRDPRREDLVLVLAEGFVPAGLEEAQESHGTEGSVIETVALRSLARCSLVDGRVLDPRGGAVARATIVPHYEPAGPPPEDPAGRALHRVLVASSTRELPGLSVPTNVDGRFTLPLPWPGSVVVTARSREFGQASSRVAIPEGPEGMSRIVQELELRFPPSFELRATVMRAGKPLPAAALDLVRKDERGAATIAAALTDVSGRAMIRAPAVAPLWLVVRTESAAPRVLDVAADPASGVDVRLDLDAGVAVTFVVTGAESLSPAERMVLVRDVASGFTLDEQPIAESGRVRLKHVPRQRALELLVPTGAVGGTPIREFELPEETAQDRERGNASGETSTAEVDLGSIPLGGE